MLEQFEEIYFHVFTGQKTQALEALKKFPPEKILSAIKLLYLSRRPVGGMDACGKMYMYGYTVSMESLRP
ncbi:MAG: hypothetical protein QXI37_02075 [Thermoprotei archaeon]